MSSKGFSFFKYSFLNASFACPKIGRALYGRHAVLWDNGQETALNMVELSQTNKRGQMVQAEQVSTKGIAGKKASIMGSSFLNASFLNSVEKRPELITWNRDISYITPQSQFSTTSLEPSLKPLDVRAKRKSTKWVDKYTACNGRFFNATFLMPGKAGEKLYDCLVLHDPKRASLKRQALSFLNVHRLGQPPYRAEALIDLALKRHPRTSFTNNGILGYHVLVPDDAKKRDGVTRAVVLSKAARDEILISFQTSRFIHFADQPALDGTVKFNSHLDNRL